MKSSPIHYLHRATFAIRIIAGLVLIAFAGLILMPTAVAARAAVEDQQRQAAWIATDEAKLARALQRIDQLLKTAYIRLELGDDAGFERNELKKLSQRVRKLDEAVTRNFSSIARQLAAKNLPDTILQRHEDVVTRYGQELSTLLANLDAIDAATDPIDRMRAVRQARDHMAGKQLKKSQQPFDPNNLPFGTMQPRKDNTPKLDRHGFDAAGLFDNPHVQLAALGDFTFDRLPRADDPAYLAETIEVTLSTVVKAKAAELNHDPVAIYHWVRNHTEWLPTWGAMQNANLTLGSRRGNSFDIASLTIALLRASGIPARYVHGTVDVPVPSFLNWAGGFTDIHAAVDFVASGGVPIAPVVSGGRITKVRMEHVWVEAAIDFVPSRGAVNKAADSWVQLDPSFKQYEYLTGLDAVAIGGIDAEALAQSFLDSGTVNETEGWVAGLDPSILEDAQVQTQQALEQYVTDNLPDATIADVIGGRRVIVKDYPMLPSALPNAIVVEGARYATLPAAVQHRMGFAFSALYGELDDAVTFAWAALNNQKVTLSFRPATPDDEQALLALLPEGEITDVSQLPASIPAYLISVVPELKVNGEVVKQGAALRLGEELDFAFEVSMPGQGRQVHRSPVVAGSYLAVAVAGGSVSTGQLDALRASLQDTQTKLESGDPVLVASLNREDLLGDMFYAGGLGYFAQYLGFAHMVALQQSANVGLAPSAGTYGYEPEVEYFFGFPRSITPGGVAMDMDRVLSVVGTEGGSEDRRQLVLQLGALSSALEHAVPEQMFVTPENPGEAISAVKALSKATAAGQRVYHITPTNQATTLVNIHHRAETMDEIRAALAVGKEVITHTDPVSVPGWSGAGYIILDPETGAGAYKIGGGKNGGYLDSLDADSLASKVAALMSIVAATLAELAESGKEIAGFFGKVFEGIGLLLELADTYEQCAASGNLAVALVSTMVLVSVGVLLGVMMTALSVVNPLATIVFSALFTAWLVGTWIGSMRANRCR